MFTSALCLQTDQMPPPALSPKPAAAQFDLRAKENFGVSHPLLCELGTWLLESGSLRDFARVALVGKLVSRSHSFCASMQPSLPNPSRIKFLG